MWDEEDGFYYDVLRLPDGVGDAAQGAIDGRPAAARARRRSSSRGSASACRGSSAHFRGAHPPHAGAAAGHPSHRRAGARLRRPRHHGGRQRASGCGGSSTRMLDEQEFLSPYGIRALSRVHERASVRLPRRRQEYRVDYLPAESDSGMFGGNSNWRGPIWMPMNVLLIRALLQFYMYYGDALQGRVPDRLRPADEPLRGGAGDRRPAARASSCATSTARRPVFGGDRRFPARSALARSPPVLRVLPRRQRRRPRRQPPDRLDRPRRRC